MSMPEVKMPEVADLKNQPCPFCGYLKPHTHPSLRSVPASQKILDKFTAYCKDHPEERFWQALRNWADVYSWEEERTE